MIDHQLFRGITTIVLDVDGVLTDGNILVTETGEMLRSMNTRDGQGIKYALQAGITIAVITKGISSGVRIRLEGLGIPHIFDRVVEKRSVLIKYMTDFGLKKEDVLYMGDDLPDLELSDLVAIFAAPSDATVDVLANADYISPFEGGKGCVREIIERVMRIQDKWLIS